MNMNIDPEWLKKMVDKEGNGIISAGGLVSRIKNSQERRVEELEEALGELVDGFTTYNDGDVAVLVITGDHLRSLTTLVARG